ncbi:MAG: H(+)-transporting ATPase [Clostridia bacterium]|nr:H(+)-transporting ATPase [Clostridia bacterium]
MISMRKKRISPTKIIAIGFLGVIAVGTILLMLPVSHTGRTRIGFVDALFTAVSAVCVTGLNTLDPGWDFSTFGHAVIALLIQIGGLGITSLGAGLIALLGGRLNQRENNLVKEALNYPTFKDVLPLIRAVLAVTFSTELIGAVMAFFTFVHEYPLGEAVWVSVFHSVASFNNAGFDIFGGGVSLTGYADNGWMNFTTTFLVIAGGFGFFATRDIFDYLRSSVRLYRLKKAGEVSKRKLYEEKPRLTLHTKVVLMMTAVLYLGGGVLLKLTEGDNITWMGAMFSSMTARTAGFTTFAFTEFSMAGVIVMCILMFIGANPGSTGGGMKTTTMFVLIKSLISTATGKEAVAFGKKIKDDALHKAFVIVSLGLCWVIFASFLLTMLEPQLSLSEVLFETVSAVATVGLSMDVTPTLGTLSKLIIIVTMYIGRLGPLTIATMWVTPQKGISRPEEEIPIG